MYRALRHAAAAVGRLFASKLRRGSSSGGDGEGSSSGSPEAAARQQSSGSPAVPDEASVQVTALKFAGKLKGLKKK